MKSLAIAAALYAVTLSSPVQASSLPPMPDASCRWVTDQSIRCTDGFGSVYTCALRQTAFIVRWS